MKNLILILSVLCMAMAPLSSVAQNAKQEKDAKNIAAQAKEQAMELKQSLNLSKEQVRLVEKGLLPYLTSKQQLDNIESISAEAKERRMEVLLGNKRHILSNILTDSQYKKYLELN